MGLVHELAPQAELVERAKAWIRGGGKGVAPWDEKGFKPPSGKVFSPAGMMTWPPANAIYRRETQDNYPGAKAILHCVYEGLQVADRPRAAGSRASISPRSCARAKRRR